MGRDPYFSRLFATRPRRRCRPSPTKRRILSWLLWVGPEGERVGGRGKSGSLDVTEGVIWRQLLLLCVPVFFSSFFQEAYSLVNTFVVGQFAGKAALGGIQATAPLVDLAVGFSVGMGTGFAVVCSQYFGAHDEERLRTSVHTAMTIALLGGLAVSVLGSLLAEPILVAMGTPADLMAESLAFVRLYFGAMVFSIVYNTGSAVQRSVGDTRSPSIIVASTCVVNIVLDLVFAAGFHMEAAGAGLATALSLVWGCAVTLLRLTHVEGAWRLDLRRLGIDPGIARVMLRTGLPLGLQSSCYSVSNIILQSTVNSFGSTVVTAFGLCGRIDAIVWMVSEALGVAVTTFSAQNFGARNYARMRRGLRNALVLTALVVGTISMVLLANVRAIAGFFIDDPEIAALTAQVMWYVGPFYVVYSLYDNIAGTIRGAGESLRPMLIVLTGSCLLRVVWQLAIVPLNHTLHMTLLSYPITWITTGIAFIVYYRFGHWLDHAKDHEERNLAA